MEKITSKQNPCEVCEGTEYYIEMGYYICIECQTLSQDLREHVFEYNFANAHRTQTRVIKRNDKRKKKINGNELTSWEIYNYVLKGYVDELIYLGASPKIKIILLQLWTTYLRYSEVAFFSNKEESLPKLSYNYYLHDAQILYQTPKYIAKYHRIGQSIPSEKSSIKHKINKKIPSTTSSIQQNNSSNEINDAESLISESSKKTFKKRRKKGIHQDLYTNDISLNQSQASVLSELDMSTLNITNDDDEELENISDKGSIPLLNKSSKNIIRNQKINKNNKTNTQTNLRQLIKVNKLLPLVYVALNILDDKFEISDLLRWSREYHISIRCITKYLPEEEIENSNILNIFSNRYTYTYRGFLKNAKTLAKLLGVSNGTLPNDPDLLKLVKRFLKNLQLPDSLFKYIEKLLLNSPILGFLGNSYTQEIRAISLIIMTLKIIFGLDGATEHQLSDIAERINSKLPSNNDIFFFNWNNWLKFYECRKAVISKYHYPSQLYFYPERVQEPEQYLRFLENDINSNNENKSKVLPREFEEFEYIFRDIPNERESLIDFPATLYPWCDYLTILLEHPIISNNLPQSILKHKYQNDSLDFIFKPKQFANYANSLGYKIKYKKGSLQKNKIKISLLIKQTYSMGKHKKKLNENLMKNDVNDLDTSDDNNDNDNDNVDNNDDDNDDNKEILTIPLVFSDYWILESYAFCEGDYQKRYFEEIHSKFSPSFRWLLEEAGKIIECTPDMIYQDLSALEKLYKENIMTTQMMNKNI